LNSQQN